MALDRTWYNSLVDDDGSGLTGSVWDKADVNQLMNAVDAELVSPYVAGFGWTAYTPTLQHPAGSWTSATPHFRFTQGGYLGKTMLIQWSIEASSVSAVATELMISVPVAIAPWAGVQMATCPIYLGTGYEVGQVMILPADPYYLHISRLAGQSFPVTSALYIRGQMFYQAQ